MNAAATTQPASVGDTRHLMVAPGRWEKCTCIMMLGMRCSSDTGKPYQEAIWEMESGRSMHGSAHENWI